MGKKFTENCRIISQEKIGSGIYSMWLETDRIAENAIPGQFVSVYTRNPAKLLPRPISLCEIDRENKRIRLVYRVTGPATGTEELSALHAGVKLKILGPVGNGFPLDQAEGKTVFLIGGGIGIPPMLETAKQLKNKAKVICTLGYRDQLFLHEDFSRVSDLYIATEDGSAGTKGNVLNAINENGLKADMIFACGPKPMLKALSDYAQKQDIPCWISMEERMACGIGACLACVCASKETDAHSMVKNKRVCTEGPVFLSTEVDL